MELYADLHIHTNSSDGQDSIEQVLEKAAHSHLKAIAITDHDTVEGLRKARLEPRHNGLELIVGVELSAIEKDKDMHILGYFMDIDNPVLLDKLRQYKEGRFNRATKIIEKLNTMGIDLKFETVQKHAQDAPIGRVHIAKALVEEELVYTYEEAFAKYIGYDCPAYAHKLEVSARDAISVIHEAGGVAVLAHPGTMHEDDQLIADMAAVGMDGVEVFHPDHDQATTRHFLELAHLNNLCVTGGSDSHGWNNRRNTIGGFTIPYHYVTKLKEHKNRTSERSH